jgi:hypothetical protein
MLLVSEAVMSFQISAILFVLAKDRLTRCQETDTILYGSNHIAAAVPGHCLAEGSSRPGMWMRCQLARLDPSFSRLEAVRLSRIPCWEPGGILNAQYERRQLCWYDEGHRGGYQTTVMFPAQRGPVACMMAERYRGDLWTGRVCSPRRLGYVIEQR